jgi:hypothetical protein
MNHGSCQFLLKLSRKLFFCYDHHTHWFLQTLRRQEAGAQAPSCSVIDKQANVVSASTWFLSFHSHHAAGL